MKGSPHKAKFAVSKVDIVRGIWLLRLPTARKSWEWWWMWIKVPAQIKSKALNNAWVNKWKKAKLGKPNPILLIITPNCLSVERAIIFFKSHSAIAFIPAMNIVNVALKRRRVLNRGVWESEL